MRHSICLTFCLVTLGCTTLPDIPISDQDAINQPDYPKLINLRNLDLNAAEQASEDQKTEQETIARVDRLRAKADQLRNAQLD